MSEIKDSPISDSAGSAGEKMKFRFDFFLSHNSADKQVIEQIAEQLLEEAGLTCWIDVWSIPAAADWEAEIQKAISACRGTLIFFGTNGWGPWHSREALMALEHAARNSRYLVIPVMLSDYKGPVPLPEADLTGALPRFFAEKNWVRHSETSSEVVDHVRSALGNTPPHPLGRARVTPYVIRRDARRWAFPASGNRRKHSSRLYRGGQLSEALVLAREYPGQLDSVALDFLQAGQQRQKRLAWWWAIATTLIASGFLVLALREAYERNVATSRLLAVLASDEHAKGNLSAACLLAVESWQTSDTVASRRELLGLAARYPHLRAILSEHSADDLVEGWTAVNSSKTQVAICNGAELNVWSLERPWEPPIQLLLQGGLGPVTFSDSGDLAVTTSTGIAIWRSIQSNKERDLLIDAVPAAGLQFGRDGIVYWVGQDGQVAYAGPDGKIIRLSSASDQRVLRLAISEDLESLVCGHEDGEVSLRNIARIREPGTRLQDADGTPINLLAISPDHRWVVAGQSRGEVKLFEIASKAATTLDKDITAVAFLSDNRLALGYEKGSIRVIAPRSPAETSDLVLVGHATTVKGIAVRDSVGVSADDGGTVLLWDLDKNALVTRELRVADRKINWVTWTGDGQGIATATWGEGFRTIIPSSGSISPLLVDPEANTVALDTYGTRFLSGSESGQFRLWEKVADKWRVLDEQHASSSVTAIAWNGSRAVSGHENGDVVFWSIEGDKLNRLLSPKAHHFAVRQISFDKNGLRLASGGLDGSAKIWDWSDRGPPLQPSARIGGGRGQTHFVKSLPSGKTVLIGGSHSALQHRSIDGTKILAEMSHDTGLTALSINATGEYAMTADMNGGIWLWHVRTGQAVISRFHANAQLITSAEFSPLESRLAAGTFDGRLLLIDLDPEAAAKYVLRMANRNFSPREWNQFMGQSRYRRTNPDWSPPSDRIRSYD